jgi:hypothetical protein
MPSLDSGVDMYLERLRSSETAAETAISEK